MKKIVKKLMRLLGPGFITGVSDDDPSGIGTYAQTGAQFGYQQLWMPFFSYPFMTALQEMCGRAGMVSGEGLAAIIRKHYSKWILYISVFLLVLANTVNIGADLGAMAATAQMLSGAPFIVWLIVMTVITLVLEVFVSYHVYSKYLKYLAFSIFAYLLAALVVKQDWGVIWNATFQPRLAWNQAYFMNIVAVLGTTISPYLFFWQASEEVEQEVETHKLEEMGNGSPRITQQDIQEMGIDTAIGMFFAVLVMFAIILTTAATLGSHGITDIQTANQAAEALRPLAGDFAYLLFSLGIIGTGLLAVPVLAGSASYALSESFGWREGLYLKFEQAHGFYGVITLATLLGILLNFIQIPPFKMLYYSAVLNGLCAPPLIVLILMIANNRRIMGAYINNKTSNCLGWMIAGIMGLAAVALLVTFRPA